MDKAQEHACDLIYREYETSKSNNSGDVADFEAVLDLLENKRTEKNYEWMSDVAIPEYPSILLTETSQFVNQYFQSRDFVDVYLEGDRPDDKVKCRAVKKLLNKTLNHQDVHHFAKQVRAWNMKSTAAAVYAVCWWNQEVRAEKVGTRQIPYELGVDVYGNQMVDRRFQVPAVGYRAEDVMDDRVLSDHFDYEIVDPRNVFTDNKYVYSLQDKDFVIIRSEKTYEQLVEDQEKCGYINLDEVKKLVEESQPQETETSKDSFNKDEQKTPIAKPQLRYLDVLERFGKFWCMVTDRDQWSRPVSVEVGYDDMGKRKEGAELVECIVAEVVSGSHKILIRLQPTPFYLPNGRPYRPLLRGLCYIHPTKDVGMSDGKYARELQVALNDTINLSNDRVKLATLPTMVVNKYMAEDNDQIFIEPEHTIPLEDVSQFKELTIRDNIAGAIQQANLFIGKMQQVTSVYPTTMGQTGDASTTATAIAGADMRANMRANYKSLTFEYTFLCELYRMIQCMAWQFMHQKTAQVIWSPEEIQAFDPTQDYTYQPVSSAIEAEHAKQRKLTVLDQVLGRLVQVPNPKTPKLVNLVMVKILDLLGSQFSDVKDALLDEGPVGQAAAMGQKDFAMQGGLNAGAASNQNGVPMQAMETQARNYGGAAAGGGTGGLY